MHTFKKQHQCEYTDLMCIEDDPNPQYGNITKRQYVIKNDSLCSWNQQWLDPPLRTRRGRGRPRLEKAGEDGKPAAGKGKTALDESDTAPDSPLAFRDQLGSAIGEPACLKDDDGDSNPAAIPTEKNKLSAAETLVRATTLDDQIEEQTIDQIEEQTIVQIEEQTIDQLEEQTIDHQVGEQGQGYAVVVRKQDLDAPTPEAQPATTPPNNEGPRRSLRISKYNVN
jgi:hypothetical protein